MAKGLDRNPSHGENASWFLPSLVFVVGLSGSLSELISPQRPAKNSPPDSSGVHTHTQKGGQANAPMSMLMNCMNKGEKKVCNRGLVNDTC